MYRRALCAGMTACLLLPSFTRIAFAEEQLIVSIVTAAAVNAKEAATVKDGKVIYKITKDENGKKVAAEAMGKKVELKGNVQDKNGVKWISVTSCKIVE